MAKYIRGYDGKKYTVEEAKAAIPYGDYCYQIVGEEGEGENHRLICKNCPFLKKSRWHRDQNNGYCRLLKQGDWQTGIGLLWDGIKSCGINEPTDYEHDDCCSCPYCAKLTAD